MNTKYAIGKCETMCPVEEMKMRQKEKLLHVFEMVPGTEKGNPLVDPKRAVKMYNRSAAGKFMTNENFLRPPEVLMKTVKYLLENVIEDTRYSWLTKYDFISDRLRAVRQDMIIQNVSRSKAISLLEPMVRFHAYSAYWSCDQDIYHFDPHLNRKTLQECLNNLLILYDQVEKFRSLDCEERFLNHINVSRPFFEALNLVLNLGNEEILFRLICLPKKFRTSTVKTAILMGVDYMRKNFVKVCRYIREIAPLLAGLSILQLPGIRRKTLQIMSVAYSSKNLRFPLNDLKQLLIYESANDVIEDCTHFGLKINGDCVHFDKNSYDNSVQEVGPKKVAFLEEYFKNVKGSTFLRFGQDVTEDITEKFNTFKL